ncbi:hypothetical protein TL16_g07123 [Triparma laevis f. inornata]|uniref:Arginyl-tRNA--protein transferase 1 n=2 Tax=Triparma laevis TaxID=1534972 RepID=A0A9W7CHA0_9STRA|nr:hypothetical protein TL16_g07123 [Triparma laevis f. inornata]GMI04576.1 hypothetical protein TrLO_g120 [Triparma laevis f. longispina]
MSDHAHPHHPNIVTPYGESSSKCGYCNGARAAPNSSPDSAKSSRTYGLLAPSLSPTLYKYLLDSGFRRSGTYIYLPNNKETCCPQHCIRLGCEDWEWKGERKVLNKVGRFCNPPLESSEVDYREELIAYVRENLLRLNVDERMLRDIGIKKKGDVYTTSILNTLKYKHKVSLEASEDDFENKDEVESLEIVKGFINITLFRRFSVSSFLPSTTKNAAVGVKSKKISYKLLPSHLSLHDPSVHRLYCEYQQKVHNDPNPYDDDPHNVDNSGFKRFLVDNPFSDEEKDLENGIVLEFDDENILESFDLLGCWHLHYLIDEELVMVSVLDFLPDALSSVYCFYATHSIPLGRWSVIKEVEFCRRWRIEWYYLGYYIESCPKMKYKGDYGVSWIRRGRGWMKLDAEGRRVMKEEEESLWEEEKEEEEEEKFGPARISEVANEIGIVLQVREGEAARSESDED